MDKRREANLRVKQNITNALFSLTEEKSLADVHITEIVEKAGVSRASFYRNYCSKEDVLVTLIRDVLDEFSEEVKISPEGFYTYENMLLVFQYFKKYESYILNLCHSGYAYVLLEELNHFHESIEGTMPVSSVEKYGIYMYMGALMNTALVWLAEDKKTSPEELAGYFLRMIK